mmetsp:Transcript_2494/g.8372  ORF Transcript_2494/g.8372 Transcript_2494/m.8372 type:complete len:289 (-) Transcript_2494:337-1203(-)
MGWPSPGPSQPPGTTGTTPFPSLPMPRPPRRAAPPSPRPSACPSPRSAVTPTFTCSARSAPPTSASPTAARAGARALLCRRQVAAGRLGLWERPQRRWCSALPTRRPACPRAPTPWRSTPSRPPHSPSPPCQRRRRWRWRWACRRWGPYRGVGCGGTACGCPGPERPPRSCSRPSPATPPSSRVSAGRPSSATARWRRRACTCRGPPSVSRSSSSRRRRRAVATPTRDACCGWRCGARRQAPSRCWRPNRMPPMPSRWSMVSRRPASRPPAARLATRSCCLTHRVASR